MDKIKLKQHAKNLQPVLRIGKNGINENVVIEVEKLLKKRYIIKIKVLNNCPIEDIKQIIEFVLTKTGSELVSKVGNTFTIYRRKAKAK
ncbi:YhbY family RNA-binding protein [archaeon]|jgi:RNA-binding protein|nr:YhbY family RNA-binding protein [archaeon]MBT4021964.1 YhbY family RNA-binding protein [archaeon]MBT4272281.1 YhbY family RNA-binding protein [archaeon]MBT4460817.1 YhbY family RNA-binding protein [archaeon]MBT4858384.1 YhbY family RNA-binding protein [archaeon]